MKHMKMTLNMLRVAGFVTFSLMAFGCSSLLDPAVCETDEDCQGGTCSEGICIGELVEPDPDMSTAQSDMSTPVDMSNVSQPDMDQIDQGVPMPDEGMPEADMAPERMLEPPVCDLIVDGPDLIAETSVGVIITASDSYDAFDALATRLTVNETETEISLNVMGQFEGQVPLDVGNNTLVLSVTDTDGQNCEVEKTIDVDVTGPVLAVTQPQSLEDVLTNQSAFTVRGTVEDAHFTDDLDILVNDRVVEPENGVQWVDGQFEFQLSLDIGWQTIALIATDDLGNDSNRVEFNVELDDQAPAIIVSSPSPNEVTTLPQRRIFVEAEIRDGGEPLRNARYTITVIGASDQLAYPESNADAFGTLNQQVVLFDGENEIQICAEDDAGNQSCVSVQVVKTAPCINIDTPTEGDYIGSLVVHIEGTVCPGVSEISVSIDGAEPRGENVLGPADISEDGHFEMDVNVFQAGGHRIQLTARTEEDERAIEELNLEFDPSPPILTIRQPDRDREDQQICVGASTRIIGTARDDQSGLESVSVNGIELDQAVIGGGGAGGEFRYDIQFDEGERARQDIDIIARNRAGLRTEYTTWVTVDTVAPSVRFDVLNPLMPINPFLRPNAQGEILLTGEVGYGECGITGGGFTLDGSVASVGMGGRFEFSQAYADGQHTIRWTAQDIAGNASEGDYSFQVDSTPPTITIDSPADGYFVSLDEGSEVQITARVGDVGSGLQQVLVN